MCKIDTNLVYTKIYTLTKLAQMSFSNENLGSKLTHKSFKVDQCTKS